MNDFFTETRDTRQDAKKGCDSFSCNQTARVAVNMEGRQCLKRIIQSSKSKQSKATEGWVPRDSANFEVHRSRAQSGAGGCWCLHSRGRVLS